MRWTLAAATGSLLCSPCAAQSSPSDFTMADRYDSMRLLTGTISPDPDGTGPLRYAAVRNTYDPAGKLTKVEKGELAAWQSEAVAPSSWSGFTIFTTTDISYDSYSRKVKEVTSSGGTPHRVTQYGYDALSRLECVAVRMNPGTFGALPSACTPSTPGAHGPDRITRNVYDDVSQLLKVQKAYGTSLQQDYATYTYSPNGKQTSVTDANGNKAGMTYDGHDRQLTWTFPSKTMPGQTNPSDYEQYGYDANGNRTSLRKRDGGTINYTYDTMNRLTVKAVPASATGAAGYSVYSGYDLRGLQTHARFGSHSGLGITTSYDGFGGVIDSTTNMDGVARTFTSTYDADGNRTVLSGNAALNGFYQSYTYDGLNRMESMGGAASTTTWYGYGARGERTSLVQGSGSTASTASYALDPAGRLGSLSHDLMPAGASAADQAWTFLYNLASQIVQKTSSNDAFASNTAYNVTRGYSVNGLNQYLTAGPQSFTYDANGNLSSDGSTAYVYDSENRMVSASGAKNATLTYDPLGRLWQVTGASGTTKLFYDGDSLTSESDGSNNWLRSYVHGPKPDEVLTWHEKVGSIGERRFLKADHQGSIVAVVNPAGTTIGVNAYDSWGIPNAGNLGRFGYTGQAWIPELGMWYYKSRFYSPTLGRFMQTDPIGYEDQINLYAYVHNDPLNGIDPSGERVIYLGGGGDGYGTNIVKRYAEARKGSFYRHFERWRALREIRKAAKLGEPIVIVGHSWGGWSAAQIAAEATIEGIEINLLVTIDPVGKLPKRSINALNRMTALWANISTSWKNEDEKTRGDKIADWGERFGGETQVSEADVNETSRGHHEDFERMMNELRAPEMVCRADSRGDKC